MDYDQFLEQVQKDLEDHFANQKEGKYSQVRIGIQEVDKLQGESYRGISFANGDSPVQGSLNLRAAHQIFENGYPYEDLVSQIEKSVKKEIDRAPGFEIEDLKDYSKIKSSLMMQLVPQKGNEDILAQIPHQKVEDLAVVYRIDMGEQSGFGATTLITDAVLDSYGISAEQLYQDALENAPLSHPASLRSMRDVLAGMGMGGGMEPLPGEPVMMVATTRDSVMGASVIQYPGFMEQAAETMGGDFFVLPSSIHEVLLIPDDGKANFQELETMVQEINQSQVAPKERLSDHVYHYDQEDRVFELASKTAPRKLAKDLEGKDGHREPSEKKTSVLAQLGEKKKEAKERAPKTKKAGRKAPEETLS